MRKSCNWNAAREAARLEYCDDSSFISGLSRFSLLPRRSPNDITIHYFIWSLLLYYLLQNISLWHWIQHFYGWGNDLLRSRISNHERNEEVFLKLYIKEGNSNFVKECIIKVNGLYIAWSYISKNPFQNDLAEIESRRL